MKKDDLIYIDQLIENLNDAVSFIDGMSLEQFTKDKKTQNATIRSFEVIGEIAKRVSIELKSKNPTIEWKDMAGFRDKLIHDYEEVDIFIVWKVVNEKATMLIIQLEEIKDKLLKDNYNE